MTTIAIILNPPHDAFLMGYHQRGEGKGKLNFIGGKVADKPEFAHETPEENVRREILEETGLVPTGLTHCADIFYLYPESAEAKSEEMKVFKIDGYTGIQTEDPDELKLKWINVDALPFDQMWESDRIWLPKVLESASFQRIEFHYDNEGRLIDSKFV